MSAYALPESELLALLRAREAECRAHAARCEDHAFSLHLIPRRADWSSFDGHWLYLTDGVWVPRRVDYPPPQAKSYPSVADYLASWHAPRDAAAYALRELDRLLDVA